jgi:hypothetical protein
VFVTGDVLVVPEDAAPEFPLRFVPPLAAVFPAEFDAVRAVFELAAE